MEQRIKGRDVNIDYNDTLEFFTKRGEMKQLEHKYNYVLYQDANPELAIQRDREEKEKIATLLTWNTSDVVLDLGCGIGRWGEEILARGLGYIGIDYCEKFVGIAKENLKEYLPRAKLLCGSVQTFREVLAENAVQQCFDKIFANGVLMYLNDIDFQRALENIGQTGKGCSELYLKETLAVEERLTLNQIYSKELTQSYSAIYRTVAKYEYVVERILVRAFGYKVIDKGPLFEEKLRNRKETIDYYMILRK